MNPLTKEGRNGRVWPLRRGVVHARAHAVIKLRSHYANISLHSARRLTLSLSLECARVSAKCHQEIDGGPTRASYPLIPSALKSTAGRASPLGLLSPSCCASFPRRAVPFLVLSSRWLLSLQRRKGGVLRLVRSIAIKDLVTRLGAALRSASSSLSISRSPVA